jgi:signal transduction histidine kinase
MKCKQFTYDFVDKNTSKLNDVFEENGLHSYFPIPKSNKYYMEISYPLNAYEQDIKKITTLYWVKFIIATLFLFIIALFFTLYSLKPIRKALQLNDEFIKDILHDFNTPITSIQLNIKMLNEENKENIFIKRITQGINNIVLLQNNLKDFLQQSPSQNEKVDIAELAKTRLNIIKDTYPKLTYNYEKKNDLIYVSNKEILSRIFDNLLSNASKYNKVNGEVSIVVKGTCLFFKDTGKGIQNVDKVMKRYYKEQERGLGLGLHIVQKLIDELNIEIQIKSQLGIGSTFILDFKHLDRVSQ